MQSRGDFSMYIAFIWECSNPRGNN